MADLSKLLPFVVERRQNVFVAGKTLYGSWQLVAGFVDKTDADNFVGMRALQATHKLIDYQVVSA